MKNFKENLKNVLTGLLPMIAGIMIINIPLQIGILYGGGYWAIAMINVFMLLFIIAALFGKYLYTIDLLTTVAAKTQLINNLTHAMIAIKFLTKNSIAYRVHGTAILSIAVTLTIILVHDAYTAGIDLLGDEQ